MEATSALVLRRLIPYVKKRVVAGRRDILPALAGRTVQRGPDLFLALRQLRERHLDRDTFLYLIEIREDSGHDRLVLSVPTLRNILLQHRLEVHRRFPRPRNHRHTLRLPQSLN